MNVAARKPVPVYIAVLALAHSSLVADEITRLKPDAATGSCLVTIVSRVNLVHTAQLLPWDQQKAQVGRRDVTEQTKQVVENLAQTLAIADTDLDRVVKLNVYVAHDDLTANVQRVIANAFAGSSKPAISLVTTRLPHANALVAMDAVATTKLEVNAVVRRVRAQQPRPVSDQLPLAVLPAGSRVYISGQAERGTLAVATRKTMESLIATLKFLKLNRRHVVQLKAFMKPMSEVSVARQEMSRIFEDEVPPPMVFVEWESTLPIEIEMIAADPSTEKNRPSVEYLTPPGMKPSPIYCRVTRANHPSSIFVSGLYGKPDSSAEVQVREIYTSLADILRLADSDLLHLVKATYYVSDQDASTMLNQLRPDYYHPQRPPAASKAMVRGVAAGGRTITLDMIAVPK